MVQTSRRIVCQRNKLSRGRREALLEVESPPDVRIVLYETGNGWTAAAMKLAIRRRRMNAVPLIVTHFVKPRLHCLGNFEEFCEELRESRRR